MKKLFYLTAMAFFFAMSVSFSPPDQVSDVGSISADVEYVADVVAQADVDGAVSFVAVRTIEESLSKRLFVPQSDGAYRHSEGGIPIDIGEESLSMRLFVPQSDGDSPDRNPIYDVGDGASKESNYQSKHEIRIDRPIDPGWCSSK